jgi:antiviral helicase SKI2
MFCPLQQSLVQKLKLKIERSTQVGTVVVMCWDDIPEEGDLRRLLTGNPTKLESQFRLTYSMILNLLRVEDLKVEDMLKRSFAEFHAQRALPEQQKQLLEREGALSKMNVKIDCILGEPTIEEYYNVALEAEKLGDRIQEAVMQSRAAQQSLVPGRVVVVKTPIVSN